MPACGACLSLLPPSARASRRATSFPPSPFLSSPSLLLPLSLTRYVQGALRLPCFVCACPSSLPLHCEMRAPRGAQPLPLPLPSSPLFLLPSFLSSPFLLPSSFSYSLCAGRAALALAPCFVCACPSSLPLHCEMRAPRGAQPLPLPLPSSPLFLFPLFPFSFSFPSSFLFLLLAMCRARCACPASFALALLKR